MSHPSRVRGLKPGICYIATLRSIVASFTGAWIETRAKLDGTNDGKRVASFTGAWIETNPVDRAYRYFRVASFTGAWIETVYVIDQVNPKSSRILHGCVD